MIQSEYIPDEDKIYRRVHLTWMKNGKLTSGAFQEDHGSMSTDWSKYSTPQEAVQRAKNPQSNGVVSFIAGELRKENLKVRHSPSPNHFSHADVIGIDNLLLDVEAKFNFMEMFVWEIKI